MSSSTCRLVTTGVAVVAMAAGCTAGRLSSASDRDAGNEADSGATSRACTDLQSDSHDCGACGHDCLGGACQAGVCQPTTLAISPADGYQIALDAKNVYWSASRSANDAFSGAVLECALAGCGQQPTVVWQGSDPIGGIAPGAASLFWVQAQEPFAHPPVLVSCPLGGCAGSPQTLLSGAYAPAVYANDVFVFLSSDATSFALTKYASGDVGHPATLCTGQPLPGAIAVDDTNVYWTTVGASYPSSSAVLACAVGGCATGPTVLASGHGAGTNPGMVAVDGATVYWVDHDSDTIRACGVAGCNGAPTTLASDSAPPGGLAVDDESIYWTSFTTGDVMKCPKTGCHGAPTLVATNAHASGGPIAVDAESIYWIVPNRGQLMRLAK